MKKLFKRKKKEKKVAEPEEETDSKGKLLFIVLPFDVRDRDGNKGDPSIVNNAKAICELPQESAPMRLGIRLYGGNQYLAKMLLQRHLVILLKSRMHTKRQGPRKPRASPAEREAWWKAMGA